MMPFSPPPPAPPPFAWACVCLPAVANYTCGGVPYFRAALTCNGQMVIGWGSTSYFNGSAWRIHDGLGDCTYATDCDAHGNCKQRWDRKTRYAAMTSSYRIDYCEASPPHPPGLPPPSPPPPSGWCEQLQSGTTWSPKAQHQPANALTSLIGVALGLFGLAAREVDDADAQLFRAVCSLLALTGLGSTLHHWWPLTGWSHAADLLPMILLCCLGFWQAADAILCAVRQSASTMPKQQTTARTDALVTFLGWSCCVLGCLSYAAPLGALRYLHVLLVAIAGMMLCHVACFVLLARRCWQRRRQRTALSAIEAEDGHSEWDGVQIYVTLCLAVAIATPAQLLEYPRCPNWLFASGVSLHGVWHVGIMYAIYMAANVALYLRSPGARLVAVRIAKTRWHTPVWLLCRCSVLGVHAPSETHVERLPASQSI